MVTVRTAVAAVLVLSSCSAAVTEPPATHELAVDTAETTTLSVTTPAPTTTTTTKPVATTSTTVTAARPARASRSAGAPRTPVPAPPTDGGPDWAALRRCESGGNYNNRRNGRYRGAYQFDRRTWAGVGGHGDPADAEPAEQDMRAAMLFAARGRQPWPYCGRFL